MKSITIKIDEELHMLLKIRLVKEGRSIREHINKLIEEDMLIYNSKDKEDK